MIVGKVHFAILETLKLLLALFVAFCGCCCLLKKYFYLKDGENRKSAFYPNLTQGALPCAPTFFAVLHNISSSSKENGAITSVFLSLHYFYWQKSYYK